MSIETGNAEPASGDSRPGDHRLALSLAGGAALCLVAAGTLLWWKHGVAVFGSMVMAGLAWCF